MIPRPPRSTRTNPLFPYTTRFRSIRRLLVSPDGALSLVPFGWLVPDKKVSLVPSGTTYGVLVAERGARGDGVLHVESPAGPSGTLVTLSLKKPRASAPRPAVEAR